MDEQDAAAAAASVASTSSSSSSSGSAASGSSSRILKFLTHKLRTHSLNEEPNGDKADDDHDSGTESDDEFQNGGDVADELSTAMDSLEEARPARDSAVPSDADLGASPPSTTATPFGFNSSSGCSSTETPPIEPPPPYDDFIQRLGHSGDQHSSEEELEVINGPKDDGAVVTVTPVPIRPSAVPEKRKWSEANSGSSSCTQVRQRDEDGGEASGGATAYSAPASRTGREASGSSDEEISGLCYSRSGSAISQPVQFRSSPPQDAHRPVRSLSPPPKLFHASAAFSSSPPCIASSSSSASEHLHHLHRPSHHHRPRSRPRPHSHYEHPHPPHRAHIAQDLADVDVVSACSPRKRHRPPRPCLDFEKMQQLKTQAVTTWRHTSEHGNELSVFCW